jgi:hypothetical protein
MAKQRKLRMGFQTKDEARGYLDKHDIALTLIEYYRNNYCNNYVEIFGDNGTVTWIVPRSINYNEEEKKINFIGTGFQYRTDVSQTEEETYSIVVGYLDMMYDPVYPDPSVITQDELFNFISSAKDFSDGYKNYIFNTIVSAYKEANDIEYIADDFNEYIEEITDDNSIVEFGDEYLYE